MFKRLTFLYWSRPEVRGSRQIQMSAVAVGLIWAVMVTLFCGVILALWVTFSEQPRYHFSGILGVCMLAGALLGGGTGGLSARKQGWLHGGTVGLIYGLLFLVMVGVGSLEVLQNPLIWVRLLLLILAGALGGIVGVNLPVKGFGTLRRMGR